MATLSVVVVTLNEERNIGRCLAAVVWADELIVVDSGSADQTLAIAQSYGARVIERAWPGDGPQKRFGVEQAESQWCLGLDADEEVSVELARSIRDVLDAPEGDCFKVHRRSYFLGQLMRHGDWGRDWIVRLFDTHKYQWSLDTVHSRLDVSKRHAKRLKGDLIHHSQEDMYLSVKKMNDYSTLSAQTLARRGQGSTVFKALLREKLAFVRSYLLRLGLLDGTRGYLLAKNIGFGAYLKYIKRVYDVDRNGGDAS